MTAKRFAIGAVALGCCVGVVRGDFLFGSIDFGGGFTGTNGSPLIPVGGSINAQANTDPATHALFVGAGLGAAGWGVTYGAIEDSAPPEGPPYVDNVLLVNPLAAVVPAGGASAATAGSFGGFYARGPIYVPDDDAFVARIGVTSGATLSTSGSVFIALQEVGAPSEEILGIDENGIVGIGPETDVRPFNYKLEYRLFGSYLQGDVYDVFVVQFPGPGTGALFGVVGVVGMRFGRRRG